MDPGERFDNINRFNKMIERSNVKNIWPLEKFVRQSPPVFSFDYDTAYGILAMVGAMAVMHSSPVSVNEKAVSELYETTSDNIREYFVWFCKIGLLRND